MLTAHKPGEDEWAQALADAKHAKRSLSRDAV
jgi:hypothetical protein